MQMLEKARELSYEGQVEYAQKLLSEQQKSSEKAEKKQTYDWDGTLLFLNMIWGAIGTGYFLYGKKLPDAVFLLCGIGLMILPLFIGTLPTSLVSGIVLLLLPFKDRLLS
jgi:hypothetical protein